MGYTDDGFPYIGEVQGKSGQYICAGFNGHGMSQIFLSAKAVAAMVVEGKHGQDAGLPRLYQTSYKRLDSRNQHVTLTAYEAAMEQIRSKL